MSCDHQVISAHVCDYVEGKLPSVLALRCAEAIKDCAHCREVHAQALEFYQLASAWEEQPVPEWQRARHAVQPRYAQHSWLSYGALAASVCAIFLVLLRVEISTQDGLLISFGGSQQEARVQELLAAELARHVDAQNALLDARLTEFADEQRTGTELMLARFQQDSRIERRQELDFLTAGWENRRYQDQRVVSAQINRLASGQQENNQYLNALMQNPNFNGGNGL